MGLKEHSRRPDVGVEEAKSKTLREGEGLPHPYDDDDDGIAPRRHGNQNAGCPRRQALLLSLTAPWHMRAGFTIDKAHRGRSFKGPWAVVDHRQLFASRSEE